MTCRTGLLAVDCAADHWCRALGGHPEPAGWRADCPVCGAGRALEWNVPRTVIRWNAFCEHDRDALRPVLAARLGDCFARRRADRAPVSHDDVIALALSDLPPMSMRLALLQLGGMSTGEALDKLGVRREHRSRVIAGRTGGAPKWVQNRSS